MGYLRRRERPGDYVVMIFQLGFEQARGFCLIKEAVAIWWAVFLFRSSETAPSRTRIRYRELYTGETIISVSFARIWATIKDIENIANYLNF